MACLYSAGGLRGGTVGPSILLRFPWFEPVTSGPYHYGTYRPKMKAFCHRHCCVRWTEKSLLYEVD